MAVNVPTHLYEQLLSICSTPENRAALISVIEMATGETLVAGTNITLTPNAGNITIASTGGSGGSGANTALSNLVSPAINAGLVPDTDGAYPLGHTDKAWTTVLAGALAYHDFNTNISLQLRKMGDSAGAISVDYGARQLLKADGTVMLDWSTASAMSSSIAANSLLSSVVTLTADQVNALNTTPFTIVPATAGKATLVSYIKMTYNHVTPFTISGGGQLAVLHKTTGSAPASFIINNDANGTAVLGTSGFLDQTTNQNSIATAGPQGGSGIGDASNGFSQDPTGLDVILTNASGSTSGGTGSTLTVTTYYQLI